MEGIFKLSNRPRMLVVFLQDFYVQFCQINAAADLIVTEQLQSSVIEEVFSLGKFALARISGK